MSSIDPMLICTRKGELITELCFVVAGSLEVVQDGEILAFLGALYRGFPNWSYDHDHPVRNEDGTIGVKWRQGGTHTGTLAFPGFEPYPPTGREVVIPEHYFFYKVAEGGLLQIRPDPVPGGAPRGIFEQIGVALPPL